MTLQGIVESALVLAWVYGLAGAIFAGLFVTRLAVRIDPASAEASWGFRLVIAPSIALLWPLVLSWVLRGRRTPIERNRHRCALRERTPES